MKSMKNMTRIKWIKIITVIALVLVLGLIGQYSLNAATKIHLVDNQGNPITEQYTGWAHDKNKSSVQYWIDAGEIAVHSKVFDSMTGHWYYVDDDGYVFKNGFLDIPDMEEYVYCDKETGAMHTGASNIDGNWYRFDEETGNMIRGEYSKEGITYYYDVNTGVMQSGFMVIADDTADGKLVYCDYETGIMKKGPQLINESWYRFDEETGEMIQGEYSQDGDTYYYDINTGIMQTGFVVIADDSGERNVYLDTETGIMQKGQCLIEDNWYCFDEETGNMIKGEYSQDGDTYYYDDETGIMLTGQSDINGSQYYFDENGIMQKGIVAMNGKSYLYDMDTGIFVKEVLRYFDAYNNIACWGDSMTRGDGSEPGYVQTANGGLDISYMSYPELLESITGVSTYNYGITGADSENIMNSAISYYNNNDVTELLILEIGSNGGWHNDYNELIRQYWAIINAADTDRYIIVGDTDDPGTSIGDLNQEAINGDGVTLWERALSQEFGNHFFNTRRYMIENGLSDCGMTPDEDDIENQSMGMISEKLRHDWTHFNSYGYYSKAKGIYQKGAALGYWY